MKVLKLIIIGLVLFFASPVQSQISLSLHFGTPPQWGPIGYPHVRYYYLPDVESYYDVQTSMFIYLSGGVWIHRTYLPSRYRNYDLYGGYKVVMSDYHGTRPYANFRDYRTRYARGYRGHEQRNIGERPGRGNSREVSYSHSPSNNRVIQHNERSVRQVNVQNVRQGNDKNAGRGNDKNKEQGHGGGKDKK